MKYIRTTDGRISYLVREPYEDFCDYEIITSKGTRTYRDETEVVKIADTIPELCEEFVVLGVYKTNKGIHFDSLSKALDYYDDYGNWSSLTIKGAIWTDEGLIYKAKMKRILPTGETEWELL